MKPIIFHVLGTPKAQPRCRPTIRGRHATVYDPGTADGWKRDVATYARMHLPRSPLDGPLVLKVTFRMPRPISHYRTGKHAGELKDSAPHYHITKPDADNLIKAVKDILTDIGMWKDDCRIVHEVIIKRYPEQDERVGAKIVIYKAETR